MKQHYERIALDDYIRTGEGGTALSYSHKDGKTLAKLFTKGMAAEYELVRNKRSFTRIISQEPEQLEPLSLRFAALARELHAKQADLGRLPAMKDLVRAEILRFKTLPEDIREGALATLELVPDATTCLHGDLHIGNIITDGTRDLWIDVGDFAYGVPEWDLCMLFYTANFMNEQRCETLFHLTPDVLKKHWEIFSRAYYGTDDEALIRQKELALHPYFAMKLIFVIGKLGYGVNPPSEGMQALMRRFLH